MKLFVIFLYLLLPAIPKAIPALWSVSNLLDEEELDDVAVDKLEFECLQAQLGITDTSIQHYHKETIGEDIAIEEMFEVRDNVTSKSFESFISTYSRINIVCYSKFVKAWN